MRADQKQNTWSWKTYAKAAFAATAITTTYLAARTWGWMPESLWGNDNTTANLTNALIDPAASSSTQITSPFNSSLQEPLTYSFASAVFLAAQDFAVNAWNCLPKNPWAADKTSTLTTTHTRLARQLMASAPNVPMNAPMKEKLLAISEEFEIGANPRTAQTMPQMTPLFPNGFLVLYERWAGKLLGVFGEVFDNDGNSISGEFKIGIKNNPSKTQADRYSATCLSNGNIAITWWESLGTVLLRIFDRNGNALTNEILVTPSLAAARPWITSFPDNIVVAFHVASQVAFPPLRPRWNTEIFAQYLNNTGALQGSPFQVSINNPSQQVYPHVSAFSTGEVVACWATDLVDNNGQSDIRCRLIYQGAPQGNVFKVGTGTPTSFVNHPIIATSQHGDGKFAVVYRQVKYPDDGFLNPMVCFYQVEGGRAIALGSCIRANSGLLRGLAYEPSAVWSTTGLVVTEEWEVTDNPFTTRFYIQRFSNSGTRLGEHVVNAKNQKDTRLVVTALSGGVNPWLALAWRRLPINPVDGLYEKLIAKIIDPTENEPPVLAASDDPVTFRKNPVVVAPDLTLSDSDSPFMQSATVQITKGFIPYGDQLKVSLKNITSFAPEYDEKPITASYNPKSGTLTIRGAGSRKKYEDVLRIITFETQLTGFNKKQSREITIVIDDGVNKDRLTRTVNVDPLANLPTLPIPTVVSLAVGGSVVSFVAVKKYRREHSWTKNYPHLKFMNTLREALSLNLGHARSEKGEAFIVEVNDALTQFKSQGERGEENETFTGEGNLDLPGLDLEALFREDKTGLLRTACIQPIAKQLIHEWMNAQPQKRYAIPVWQDPLSVSFSWRPKCPPQKPKYNPEYNFEPGMIRDYLPEILNTLKSELIILCYQHRQCIPADNALFLQLLSLRNALEPHAPYSGEPSYSNPQSTLPTEPVNDTATDECAGEPSVTLSVQESILLANTPITSETEIEATPLPLNQTSKMHAKDEKHNSTRFFGSKQPFSLSEIQRVYAAADLDEDEKDDYQASVDGIDVKESISSALPCLPSLAEIEKSYQLSPLEHVAALYQNEENQIDYSQSDCNPIEEAEQPSSNLHLSFFQPAQPILNKLNKQESLKQGVNISFS